MADQSFIVNKSVAQQAKILFVITALISGFLVFQLARMLYGVSVSKDMWALVGLIIMATGFSWYFYHIIKSTPYRSLSIDADGLWQNHVGKAIGLVRWNDIFRIREDGLLGNLYLIGQQGNTLLKVAYGLDEFTQLRELISEKMAFQPPSLPKVFRPKAGLLIGFSFVAIILMVVSLLSNSPHHLGLGVLFLAIGIFFGLLGVLELTQKVIIEHDRIRLGLSTFKFSEITSVSISDQVIKGQVFSSVKIDFSSNSLRTEPLVLESLNTDSLTLQRTILWAIKNSSQSNPVLKSDSLLSAASQIENKPIIRKGLPIPLLLVNGISWIFVFLALREIIYDGNLVLKLFDHESAKYVLAVGLTIAMLAGFNIVRFFRKNNLKESK